jgi:hypothetical protein
MLWDFLRFQLVWLIFFISGFLALRQLASADLRIDLIDQW